jgi:hypothetical protein
MALIDQWIALESELPDVWSEARLSLRLDEADETQPAAALLAPLQPLIGDEQTLSLRIVRDGNGPGLESLRRGLARVDARRLRGRLSLLGTREHERPPAAERATLAEDWELALAAIPADWSDLLGQIELDSSDFLDRAAVLLAPVNPRRSGEMTALRFRSARHFGYGASPGMVAACLRRCDANAISGRVQILRTLSDTRPVGTQGPVWHLDGEMV